MNDYQEAIETLGSLVSRAGGEGDEALDVFKDTVAEVERLREVIDAAYDAADGSPDDPAAALHRVLSVLAPHVEDR